MTPAQLAFRGYLEGIIEAEHLVRHATAVRQGGIENARDFQKWARQTAG